MILKTHGNYLGILETANIFCDSFRNREYRPVEVRRDLELFKAKVEEGIIIN